MRWFRMISVLDGQPGSPAGKGASADKALVLGLAVAGCKPPIWRRIIVRESMWLNQLHDAIQIVFDWFDYQTHEFVVGDKHYGNPFKRKESVVEDDRDVTLADIDLPLYERMLYRYHFGEGWVVEIRVEKVLPIEKKLPYPMCILGERAGPPEDCGGLEAFHDMLACIQEPHTEIGQEWIAWLGPEYDSAKCDLGAINKALRERAKQQKEDN